MHHVSPRIVIGSLAFAGSLFCVSGCLTGVKVGEDGQGGGAASSTSTSTSASTSASSGGDMPTAMSCTSPSALLCPWGQHGGPCGGNLPFKKDCDPGLVCVGGTADTEGTCVSPGQTLANPGDACGAAAPNPNVYPWNYECNAPIAPDGLGTIVPGHCTLGNGAPLVSTASVTIDGDGPTQHYDFACSLRWGSLFTGEANAFFTEPGPDTGNYPQPGWLYLVGCKAETGDPYGGSIEIGIPTAANSMMSGWVDYRPPGLGNLLTFTSSPTITVTEMNSDIVRGSYDAVVQDHLPPGMNTMKHLTGTFEVCRLPNHEPYPSHEPYQ